jgi:Protein of unknown function (DUF2829)
MNDLPRYRCHKEVQAIKIDNVEPILSSPDNKPTGKYLIAPVYPGEVFEVSGAYVAKHNPQHGGYFVRYDDGYESFSPAAALEAGYACVAPGCLMDFSDALREALAGRRITRDSWKNHRAWIFHAPKGLMLSRPDGMTIAWAASSEAILAKDWKVVE